MKEVSFRNLTSYLDDLLLPSRFKDFCPNGLHVEGVRNIRILATGVTASMKCIEKACALGADALLVHHGLFWKGDDPRLVGPHYRRVRLLIERGLGLFSYHLPLDVHEKYGNNAQIGLAMGWQVEKRMPYAGVEGLGYVGKGKTDETLESLLRRLEVVCAHAPLVVLPEGVKDEHLMRRVAWCSGAAADFLSTIAEEGVDLVLTGEISERHVHMAREYGLVLVAAGHHATERFGVKALGDHLADHFGIRYVYVEDYSPV